MTERIALVELGSLIQQAREARGLTQDAVAAAVKTSRTTVALLEQGRRLCDGEVLAAICRRIGLVENFWLHARVRKLAPGLAYAVRCHCLTYYTARKRITLEAEKKRTDLVLAVKNQRRFYGNGQWRDATAWAAELLRPRFSHLFVQRTLVPVPTSGATGELNERAWPALRIANAIASLSTGSEVVRLIERHSPIRKSSVPGQPRPSVAEQVATLTIAHDGGTLPLGIVLVDDVVTLGTTMTACATALREAGWVGELDALAIAYTRGPQDQAPADGLVFTYSMKGTLDHPQRAPVRP